MDRFYTYALFSEQYNKIYIGYSSNVNKRFLLIMMKEIKLGQQSSSHGKLFIQKVLRIKLKL